MLHLSQGFKCRLPLFVLIFWSFLANGQEAIVTTPYSIQSFYCDEGGNYVNVVYKNQEDHVTPNTNPSRKPYQEIMLLADGQKLNFNEKEHVIWSDYSNAITLYNDFDYNFPEGRLRLYQLENGNLTILKNWKAFHGHNLFYYFPDSELEYFLVTDTHEGGGSTGFKILDVSLNELWARENLKEDIHNFHVEYHNHQLSITYLTFSDGENGGKLHWCIYDTNSETITADLEFDTGSDVIHGRTYKSEQLFFSYHNPSDRTFGFKIIDKKGNEIYHTDTDIPIKKWLNVNGKLCALSHGLEWLDLDPTTYQLTLKESLIQKAEAQFPRFETLEDKIFYSGVRSKIVNKGEHVLFTIPVGESGSPFYKSLLVLVYSKDWTLRDAFQLEGPAEYYKVRENSTDGFFISFAEKLYGYEFK